jgi:hypothetical protein
MAVRGHREISREYGSISPEELRGTHVTNLKIGLGGVKELDKLPWNDKFRKVDGSLYVNTETGTAVLIKEQEEMPY